MFCFVNPFFFQSNFWQNIFKLPEYVPLIYLQIPFPILWPVQNCTQKHANFKRHMHSHRISFGLNLRTTNTRTSLFDVLDFVNGTLNSKGQLSKYLTTTLKRRLFRYETRDVNACISVVGMQRKSLITSLHWCVSQVDDTSSEKISKYVRLNIFI